MISLGFCGETMKSAAMTLSHSPCHSATFISPSCLPPSTSHPLVSSPPLFNSSWGKFIDSPLFACHLHIFNCHDREHSSLKWWSRVRVRAISCPGFLKNETPWHLFVFSSIWAKKKNASNLCSRVLKVVVKRWRTGLATPSQNRLWTWW